MGLPVLSTPHEPAGTFGSVLKPRPRTKRFRLPAPSLTWSSIGPLAVPLSGPRRYTPRYFSKFVRPSRAKRSSRSLRPLAPPTVTESGAVRLGIVVTWPMPKSLVGTAVGSSVTGSISQSSFAAVPLIADGVIVNVSCGGSDVPASWASTIRRVGVTVLAVHRPVASSVTLTPSTLGSQAGTSSGVPSARRRASVIVVADLSFTSNALASVAVPPSGFVTTTLLSPVGAFAASVTGIRTRVASTKITAPSVAPVDGLSCTVIPLWNLVPVTSSVSVSPWKALPGLTPDGRGFVTVNASELLLWSVPFATVTGPSTAVVGTSTARLEAPPLVGLTVTLALFAAVNVTLLAVALPRLVPLIVTEAPVRAAAGLIEESEGGVVDVDEPEFFGAGRPSGASGGRGAIARIAALVVVPRSGFVTVTVRGESASAPAATSTSTARRMSDRNTTLVGSTVIPPPPTWTTRFDGVVVGGLKLLPPT